MISRRRTWGRIVLLLGWGSIGTGWLAVGVCFLIAREWHDVDVAFGSPWLPCFGLAAVGIVGHLAGTRLRAFGRGWMQPTAEEKLLSDKRPPVLFLRSFIRDSQKLGLHRLDESNASPATLEGFVETDLASMDTVEEVITGELDRLGPTVAIGRPGERVPPVGAARLYVPDGQDWKSVVLDLARRARIVGILVDTTEGVAWEIEQISAACGFGRVVVFFPPRRAGSWAAGWAGLRTKLTWLPDVDSLTIAVVFDGAGAPTLVAAPRRSPGQDATGEIRHWEYVAGVENVVDSIESRG